MNATASAISRGPLFLLAGCHASLHWVLATFYVLLPSIKSSLGLSYEEAGLLASVVHFASFAANIPSGAIVDMSGRRVACQLVSLVLAGCAILALGFSQSFIAVAVIIAILAAMNTLWHPAAISFLSERYQERRGMALSVHTIGASIGDALAPLSIGIVISWYGWQAATYAAAGPPLVAACLLVFVLNPFKVAVKPINHKPVSGLRDYLSQMRSMIVSSGVWVVCALAGLRGTAQVGLRTFLPLFVVNELGGNAIWAGAILMVFQGAGALSTPFVGSASDKFGRAPVMFVGLAVSAVGIIILTFATNLVVYAATVAVIGASLLALRPVVQGWALDQTPQELGGSTISILFTTQAAFGMSIPYLGGVVADNFGLDATFRMLAGLAIVAAAAAYWAHVYQRRRDRLA